jgi:hypothetical protein
MKKGLAAMQGLFLWVDIFTFSSLVHKTTVWSQLNIHFQAPDQFTEPDLCGFATSISTPKDVMKGVSCQSPSCR